MRAKTITIATHKGGTGKTVTAMALGAGLARAKKKILIVDLDPQAHSTIGLGLELANGDLTLRELLSEPPAPVTKIIRDTHLDFLKVAPSHIRLERIAQSLYAWRTARKKQAVATTHDGQYRLNGNSGIEHVSK